CTERQTVAQYLDQWLENSVKRSVRPRTYTGYFQTVKLYIKPKIGNLQLQKLGPQHVQKMLNELAESGLGARTVAYSRTVLRCALSKAFKWGLVARNVATLVDPPRYKRPEIKPFTIEEVRVFLGSLKDDRLAPLYQLALTSGLRLGEALGLRWEDIDLHNRT